MVPRPDILASISTALSRSPVVLLLGPRQCGKTTLARQLVPYDDLNYFDLEDPASLARLDEPVTALGPLEGLVVIDEIKRRQELFPVLRVLVDRTPSPSRFLILGSASSDLMRHASESLAGRVERITMRGFSLSEVEVVHQRKHWLRGGFPRSYLAANEADSAVWRREFMQTVVERDVPQLGLRLPAVTLFRFWTMLAHYHGQVWNAAESARSLGVAETTTRRYLDVLEGLFMVRRLNPWFANLKKRQVRSPRIYVRDSGLLHALLGIRSERDLMSHPKSGASWEGYVVEEVLSAFEPDETYSWATHNGAELDLYLVRDGRRIGVECKRQDAPRVTRSMRVALEDLALDHLYVVYPGCKTYAIGKDITVTPLAHIKSPGLSAPATEDSSGS
ncbi:MAG: ATP-binding protein [Gemmatimonadetes bacterium]|nr:ATP-binding protein [Gemmatimonadota bacterium]MYH19916.1 ATP-binding protein [Gemmatimonadota bacterium]